MIANHATTRRRHEVDLATIAMTTGTARDETTMTTIQEGVMIENILLVVVATEAALRIRVETLLLANAVLHHKTILNQREEE